MLHGNDMHDAYRIHSCTSKYQVLVTGAQPKKVKFVNLNQMFKTLAPISMYKNQYCQQYKYNYHTGTVRTVPSMLKTHSKCLPLKTL